MGSPESLGLPGLVREDPDSARQETSPLTPSAGDLWGEEPGAGTTPRGPDSLIICPTGEAGRQVCSSSAFLELGATQGWKGGYELVMRGAYQRQAPRLKLGIFVSKIPFGQGRRTIKGEKLHPSAQYSGVHTDRSLGEKSENFGVRYGCEEYPPSAEKRHQTPGSPQPLPAVTSMGSQQAGLGELTCCG